MHKVVGVRVQVGERLLVQREGVVLVGVEVHLDRAEHDLVVVVAAVALLLLLLLERFLLQRDRLLVVHDSCVCVG